MNYSCREILVSVNTEGAGLIYFTKREVLTSHALRADDIKMDWRDLASRRMSFTRTLVFLPLCDSKLQTLSRDVWMVTNEGNIEGVCRFGKAFYFSVFMEVYVRFMKQ